MRATPGTTVPFSATVTNHGSVAATGVKFTLVVTEGAQVTITDTQVSGNCQAISARAQTCTLDFASLSAGGSWTISGLLTVPDQVGTAEIGAVATSGGSEPVTDPHPNAASRSMTVDTTSVVNLQPAAWTWAPNGLVAGEMIYSYDTLNVVGAPVAGVTMSQTFPTGWTIGEASIFWSERRGSTFEVVNLSGTCSTSGQTVTCEPGVTLGALGEVMSSPMMQVQVTPSSAGSFVVSHEVGSSHPEVSPDPNPNTVDHPVTIGS